MSGLQALINRLDLMADDPSLTVAQARTSWEAAKALRLAHQIMLDADTRRREARAKANAALDRLVARVDALR